MNFVEIEYLEEIEHDNRSGGILLLICSVITIFSLFIFSIAQNSDNILPTFDTEVETPLSENNNQSSDTKVIPTRENETVKGQFIEAIEKLKIENRISTEEIRKINAAVNNFYDISRLYNADVSINFDTLNENSIQNIKLQIDDFRYLKIKNDVTSNADSHYVVSQVFEDRSDYRNLTVEKSGKPDLLINTSSNSSESKFSKIKKNYLLISRQIKLKDKLNFLNDVPTKTLVKLNTASIKDEERTVTLKSLVRKNSDTNETVYFSLNDGRHRIQYYLANDGSYYTKEGVGIKKTPLFDQPLHGKIVINSKFGLRRHPVLLYKTRMHTGVDLKASYGTPIYAAADGHVEFVGTKHGYGKYILLRHESGYKSGYGHLSKFSGKLFTGSFVKKGELIGNVGTTGLSSGPHLHYENIERGKFVNPTTLNVSVFQKLSRKYNQNFNKRIENINEILRVLNTDVQKREDNTV